MDMRLTRVWIALIIIVGCVFIVYSNIYRCPFVFDDVPWIEKDLKIRSLSHYLSLEKLLRPRGIAKLSFALNYKFGRLDVFGYHLVNVLIHIANGFLAYFLALTLFKQLSPSSTKPPGDLNGPNSKLKRPKSKRRRQESKTGRKQKSKKALSSGHNAHPAPSQSSIINLQSSIPWMSLFAALIFIAHPIQTQAVTYTVQWLASMAAIFYMASVLFYVKARIIQRSSKGIGEAVGGQGSEVGGVFRFRPLAFYALSACCAFLAFLSKQNTASLPLMILLLEYMLFEQTWQEWKRKLTWLVPVFLLFGLFVLHTLGLLRGELDVAKWLEDVSERMTETEMVGRWEYLCTQFNVLVYYIRLLFLPIGQNLDYMYPFKSGFFDGFTPLAFLFLVGIVAIGVWNIKRRPIISLGIFWFFITLSVESSVIPIRDALFEHRLCLPMFGFALVMAYAVFYFLSKRRSWAILISSVIIIFLGTATYLRNRTWHDGITLWSDVVSKSPHNSRAHNNLGNWLEMQGRSEEAIVHLSQALRIKPDYSDPHKKLGVIMEGRGNLKDAMRHYAEALKINPDDAGAHNNIGGVLGRQGRLKEAISHFSEALRVKPDLAEAHINLGIALVRQRDFNGAIRHFSEALKINPDLHQASYGLERALRMKRRFSAGSPNRVAE